MNTDRQQAIKLVRALVTASIAHYWAVNESGKSNPVKIAAMEEKAARAILGAIAGDCGDWSEEEINEALGL